MPAACTAMIHQGKSFRSLAFIALSVSVWMCTAPPTSAQQADARESKLMILERMWNEAQVNRDSQALDQLVSSRFINTEWDGSVSNKSQFLADIKDPLFKPTLATIQDVKMNFFGDTAVITGTYHTAGTYQGKPYDHVGRFTDTWIFDLGKWQCVASHTSLIRK